MTLVGVIFEKGIKLSRAIDGQFYFQSIPGRELTSEPRRVIEEYGVRPVLAIYGDAVGPQITTLLPPEAGQSVLEIQHSDLDQIAYAKHVSYLSHTFNLSYLIGAVVHHCKRLATVYSNITSEFAKFHHTSDDNIVIFGNQPEPYFEFESLISSARRAYDSTRYIFWQAFMPNKRGVPSSFRKALAKCDRLPDQLKTRLEHSWSSYGNKVTDYRDCLQHYCPIGREMPSALMEKLRGNVWTTSVWIPDNPKVRSQKQYTYEKKLDALRYGWELTTEVLDMARSVIKQIPGEGVSSTDSPAKEK